MCSRPTLGTNRQRQRAGPRLVHPGLVAVLFAFSMPAAAQEKPLQIRENETRPNVLVVLMDDLGWRDLGCYGGRFIKTPVADRLAREGMRSTDAYAAAPVCSPTRASLLTGQSPGRIGMYEVIQLRDRPYAKLVSPPLSRELPETLETVGEILSRRGYVCGSVGKWHVGRTPVEEGFVTIAEQLNDSELAAMAARSPQKQIGKYTAQALRFLRDHRDRPFLLFLNHHAVHAPLEARHERACRRSIADAIARGGRCPLDRRILGPTVRVVPAGDGSRDVRGHAEAGQLGQFPESENRRGIGRRQVLPNQLASPHSRHGNTSKTIGAWNQTTQLSHRLWAGNFILSKGEGQ